MTSIIHSGDVRGLFHLDGRLALVTGASRGLGRHFALTLARAGARLALAARDVDKLSSTADEINGAGGEAMVYPMDVTVPEAVERALAAMAERQGTPRILVNNAGVVDEASFLDESEEMWLSVIETNLNGAWRVARATARHMVAAGVSGSLIHITSLLAGRVAGGSPAYCATKAGLEHLTRAAALELATKGIRVNALAPGYIETDLNRALLRGPLGQGIIERIPMKRCGLPEDLEGALLLLASDASRWMTGSVIAVDGGHAIQSVEPE